MFIKFEYRQANKLIGFERAYLTYQPNILLSSTNLFIGGWWREDFAWWRVRWWRDRSLVANSLVASLLGGEVTGYLAKTPFNYTITAQTPLAKCDDYRFQKLILQFPALGKKYRIASMFIN